MQNNNGTGICAAWARGFMALFAMLAMGLGLMASRVEAAPFAYVAGGRSNNVSVIDMATNMVVATIPVGSFPAAVAVTPDGKHVYVVNNGSNNVSVIDTASNMVVGAAIPVGITPGGFAVAVTPNGKHAYVANEGSDNVSVIDTASNTVVTTVAVGVGPNGVAVAPDGKHAYVANSICSSTCNNVSVIDTATNMVTATVPVGSFPAGIAVTPDGKHAYVTNVGSNNVSVIATASNTVVGTPIPVGGQPQGIAVTPDGKHAYVANNGFPGTVSVIETTMNTVVTTVPVGRGPFGGGTFGVAVTPDGQHVYVTNLQDNSVSVIDTASNTVAGAPIPVTNPQGVGIIPPPVGVPFLAFSATLNIHFGGAPNQDTFNLHSQFTLSSTASIDPVTEAVTLQVGTFATTIPPGSFRKHEDGSFNFAGVINGVTLNVLITPTGTMRYAFNAKASGANLTGTKNLVPVMLTIGDDSGATSVARGARSE